MDVPMCCYIRPRRPIERDLDELAQRLQTITQKRTEMDATLITNGKNTTMN